MQLYLTQRGEVSVGTKREEWALISAKELAQGGHTISHNDVSIPITVLPETVVIHVSLANGKLYNARIGVFGDDWTLAARGSIIDISFGIDEKLEPLQIYSGDDGFGMLLEWHAEAPEPFKLPVLEL